MSYRLRYQVWLDWVGPGMGPMGSVSAPLSGSAGGSGNAQTKSFSNAVGGQNIQGTGANGAIAAADITTITNAMATDISAQMNAQPALGQIQGFATGGL